MKLFLQPIIPWQDQFCEEVYFKFVTKGVAFLSTVENQEGSEICLG
jgi:hypothetical protein